MNKRVKIYLSFFICFCFCMTLYLFSTYFKSYTQQLFKAEPRFWNIEFTLVMIISLLNGLILEHFNKIIFQKPEKIFTMIKYLIFQLYLFSIVLFYIMMAANNIRWQGKKLVSNVIEINLLILFIYVFYLWYKRKKEHKKLNQLDLFKIVIGASLIMQSSVIELIFLGIYLLLLYSLNKIQSFWNLKLSLIVWMFFLFVTCIEINLIISDIDMYSKVILSFTNGFIVYVGYMDLKFWNEKKA